jgi:hypothetical protein
VQQLFKVIDCIYPDVYEVNISADDIEAENLKLFWEQVKLVAYPQDISLKVVIHGKEVRSQTSMHASLRIYACSIFLSSLHTQLTIARDKCDNCLEVIEHLNACSRCHCAQYCGRECQKKHFPSHKKECKVVLKELYERYNSEGIQTGITSLVMSLEGFMFPKLKEKWLTSLERYAKAEANTIMQTDRANSLQKRTFRPDLS